MTLPEFQNELNRLIEQFGKNSYSQSRAELIWQEVKDFEVFWWRKTVDHLLMTCRQAPLHMDFGPLIADERDRVWRIQKQRNEKDAKNFFHGTYPPDDAKTICQMILKRVQGGVSDSDYESFLKHLTHAGNSILWKGGSNG